MLALAGLLVFGLGTVRHRVRHSVRAVPRPPAAGPLSTPTAPVAPAGDTLGPALFGFNDSSSLLGQTDEQTAVDRGVRAGANVVRYTVNWDYVEPKRGDFYWFGYDRLYAAALRRHVKPVLAVAFAPAWARPLDVSCAAPAHCHNPPDRQHDADWSAFVGRVAARYPKAAAIEVWNEPKLIEFWRSGPDVGRYADLVQLAYDAVKAKAPHMTVLAGALSNTDADNPEGSKAFQPYLDALLDRGVRFDDLAMHDYELWTRPTWFDDTLDIARGTLEKHGRGGTSIWVTEFGVTTTGDHAVTAAVQANRLLAMLQTLGKRSYVEAALVHTTVPPPSPPNSPDPGFAVLKPDGSVTPAYCALAAARRVSPPAGCPNVRAARR
jgi:hypothetical protein